jgi:hypothetical protein
VRIAGGWGQLGGHGPLTNMYGLGVDQWLEFQIVTADGKLMVANEVGFDYLGAEVSANNNLTER